MQVFPRSLLRYSTISTSGETMRRHALILCCAAILFFYGSLAFAQKSADKVLDGYGEKVLNHAQNLLNMAEALTGTDSDVAMELNVVASSASDRVGFLSDLLLLRAMMVNSLDRTSVLRVFQRNKKYFLKLCDNDSARISHQIAHAHSPAVVSEGEHLRDDLDKTCNYVRSIE